MTPLIIALMRRLQVVDYPSARSSHLTPTLRGGGISVLVAASAALVLPTAARSIDTIVLGVAAAAFGVVGLVEDIHGVRPISRLGIQVVFAAVAAPLLLRSMGLSLTWQLAATLVVIAWLIAYVNAFNFMDGINGIAAAQVIVAGMAWTLIGYSRHVQILTIGGIAVVGAALGFAPFNFPRARIFLGDVGSYFLGAWLGALAVLGIRAGIPAEAVLAPLCVYLADTGTTLLHRAFNSEPWYRPHRSHAYQRLIDLGWTHTRTTTLVALAIAACSALGAVSLSSSLPGRTTADVALVTVLSAYLASPYYVECRRRRTTARHQ